MPMRFRHLKKTSKEAVGVYRWVEPGGEGRGAGGAQGSSSHILKVPAGPQWGGASGFPAGDPPPGRQLPCLWSPGSGPGWL